MADGLFSALKLTPEMIEEFIADFARRSRSDASVSTYQRRLEQFYGQLPPSKEIHRDTLYQMREGWIAAGLPNRSINLSVSAVNSMLEFYRRRDLQLIGSLEQTKVIAPELTRSEYLRLLMTAKALRRERPYLLIKVFVSTGLNSRELERLTVEAVRAGRIAAADRGIVPIPAAVCRELLDYCRRNGRVSGAVFVTQEGSPLRRTAVNSEIRRLARDARVEESKCSPITLRRLYLATQEQIVSGFAVLIEQSHDRLLEKEQLSVGWE